MEKQLSVTEATVFLGTPHMSYKKSHSGSTGNIHGISDQPAGKEFDLNRFSSYFRAH